MRNKKSVSYIVASIGFFSRLPSTLLQPKVCCCLILVLLLTVLYRLNGPFLPFSKDFDCPESVHVSSFPAHCACYCFEFENNTIPIWGYGDAWLVYNITASLACFLFFGPVYPTKPTATPLEHFTSINTERQYPTDSPTVLFFG